jgi:lysyl-tRNA synthetase, class II
MSQDERTDSYKLREERLHKKEFLLENFQINPYLLHLEEGFKATEENNSRSQSEHLWTEFKKNRLLSQEFKEKFEDLPAGEKNENLIWVAGRIHSDRNNGMFLDIYDENGKIQIVTEKSELENPASYQQSEKHLLELIDKGDIIAVQGNPYRTPRGELSLKSKTIWLLSKAIQPPPEIIENKRRRLGLTDVETKYRQRYLDLMVNPDSREVFKKRAKIIAEIRHYLNEKNFLEFETPVLQTEAGGAAAKPFTTHHNALNLGLYLRIATELHLKRLLVGGFERVYEIGRIFRNEGISTRHNPEFTSIEIYQAFADYTDMMSLTENLIIDLAEKVLENTQINYKNHEINLKPAGGWRKVKMTDLVHEMTGKLIDPEKTTLSETVNFAKEAKVEIKAEMTVGEILIEFFEQKCEAKLIQPTFVTHYPRDNSPLAFCSAHSVKANENKINNNPQTLERFELFVCGRELANGFTELNDGQIQKQVFEMQQKQRQAGNEEAHPLDQDFVEALEYGMPPAGGVGIGIDRLIMLLVNAESIRDVILFPTMKPVH